MKRFVAILGRGNKVGLVYLFMCYSFHQIFLALLILTVTGAAYGIYQSCEGKIIKEIRIKGTRWTREYIILRELYSQKGKPCTFSNLQKDKERLDRLGIFSQVEITPFVEEEQVVLEIEVHETFPYLPTLNLKISDEDGVQAGVGFKSVNMFGKAIYFSGKYLFGKAQNIEVEIRDPWLTGNHFGYRLEYYHHNRTNVLYDFRENADELFLRLGSYLYKDGRIGVLFSLESIRSNEVGKTLSPDNKDNVITVGGFLGYYTIDYSTSPSRGWWNELEISRVGGFGTDGDYWRLVLDMARYEPLFDHNTLAVMSLLTLTDGKVGQNMAVWQQYALGGSNSVRGWKLGMRYGSNQFVNTVEYRYNFMEPRRFQYFGINAYLGLQVAGFLDVGQVWSENREFTPNNFIFGSGIGIRFIIPYVGVIRFDFALRQPAAGVQLHIEAEERKKKWRLRVR